MLTEIKCSQCGKTKDVSNFHKRKDTKLGYNIQCKNCVKEAVKKNDLLKLKCRQCTDCIVCENPLKSTKTRAENLKEWVDRNRSEVNEYNRDYHNLNKDVINERKRATYNKDLENSRFKKRKSYHNSAEERRRWRRKKNREKSKTDPQFRLSKNLRRRISIALKSNKEYRTSEYLGCNVGFLKEYLENQFTSEMNWDNYGTYWHLDHKIPVSWFDLTKKEEAAKAFHYTNTQPLEAKENLRKNNRYKHV